MYFVNVSNICSSSLYNIVKFLAYSNLEITQPTATDQIKHNIVYCNLLNYSFFLCTSVFHIIDNIEFQRVHIL